MNTTTENILVLNRMVQDAEESAYAAELELAAAQAEVLQLREVVARQKQTIEAQTHAAVCAHREYRRVVAERDALVGRLMGGIELWSPVGSRN